MWYYVENGQQRGPVSDAELESLHQAGTITTETLIWREGMANWQPWREVRAAPGGGTAAEAGGAASGGLMCSECGKGFQPDEVIRINDRWVCAGCKPVVLQRLQEGTYTGSSTATGLVSEAQVRERDYEHEVGAYLGQSWELFKADPGIIIGASALIGLCLFAINAIPYLSVILSLIFTGPLMGGLFKFFLKKLRGEAVTVGDAFSGFGPQFGQLLLGNFIPGILAGLAVIPGVVVIGIIVAIGAAGHQGEPHFSSILVALMILVGFASFCVMCYLQICWGFTLWLVADKKMTFWPAMSLSRAVVCKHWWQTLLLAIVSGLIMLLGILLCCVGVLVTAPISAGMWAYAYEKLFGDMLPAE
jgi:hypothetical protein